MQKQIFFFIFFCTVLLHISCLEKKQGVSFKKQGSIILPDTVYTNWDFDVENNRVYIADWDFFKLHVLDTFNNAIRTISFTKGRGPGELIFPQKIRVDSGKIYILNNYGRKVSSFDTLGMFKNSFNINFSAHGLQVVEGRIFLIGLEKDSKYICHEYDNMGNHVKSFAPGFEPDGDSKKQLQRAHLTHWLPSSYYFNRDTLWMLSPYESRIKSFSNNKEILNVMSLKDVIAPIEFKVAGNETSVSLMPQPKTMSNLAVDEKYIYFSAWNTVSYYYYFIVHDKETGEIVATKKTPFTPKTKFTFFKYLEGKFYMYSKAGIGEIEIFNVSIKH